MFHAFMVSFTVSVATASKYLNEIQLAMTPRMENVSLAISRDVWTMKGPLSAF